MAVVKGGWNKTTLTNQAFRWWPLLILPFCLVYIVQLRSIFRTSNTTTNTSSSDFGAHHHHDEPTITRLLEARATPDDDGTLERSPQKSNTRKKQKEAQLADNDGEPTTFDTMDTQTTATIKQSQAVTSNSSSDTPIIPDIITAPIKTKRTNKEKNNRNRPSSATNQVETTPTSDEEPPVEVPVNPVNKALSTADDPTETAATAKEKRGKKKKRKVEQASTSRIATETIKTDDESNEEDSLNADTITTTTTTLTGSNTPTNNATKNLWIASFKRSSVALMVTYVFGEEAASLKRFRMFLESAKHSGFDFVVVGDHEPPFPLPDNVHHYEITWDEFADRVFQKIFRDHNRTLHPRKANLKNAWFYKVCDFKPLFGYLFPELAQGYEWWGHCDNDMILGNLTKFFPRDAFLDKYDIISGDSRHKKHKAWGPFQLYRNIPAVNELWTLLPPYLIHRFAENRYYYFDEWGQLLNRPSESMTGLIGRRARELGLRDTVATAPYLLDKWGCLKKARNGEPPPGPPPAHCAECVYRHGTLTTKGDQEEVAFCHYQASKNVNQENSLQDEAKLNYLIQSEEFRVSYLEGFDYIDPPPHQPQKVARR